MAVPDDDEEEWVRPAVAAERLHVGVESVRSMIRRGKLETSRDERGRWLVRLPVLTAIAEEDRARATLSADEALAATGVAPGVFWTAVYRRRLRVRRRGGEVRFHPADLDAWLEAEWVPARRRESRSRPTKAAAGDELVRFEKAAARVGVAPATFWRWLNDAGLPFVLAPGIRQRSVRYVRLADVERLAAKRRPTLRRGR